MPRVVKDALLIAQQHIILGQYTMAHRYLMDALVFARAQGVKRMHRIKIAVAIDAMRKVM